MPEPTAVGLPTVVEKCRLLLVDDEPVLLRSMVRCFAPFRGQWDVRPAASGEEALALLQAEVFDVVISDMRMPGMDGARLLEQVRERWPNTVRLIHSGQSSDEAAVRALGTAHQFLAKPWELTEVQQSLVRIFTLRAALLDKEVQAAASRVNVLPSQVQMLQRLQRAVASERSTPKELATIISEDMALTAKLLQTVNSAFFGLARRISRVEEAITYLGFSTVRSLAQAVNVFSSFGGSARLDAVHQHCTAVARVARGVAPPAIAEEAFTAGLLHDIGLLVLSSLGRDGPDAGTFHEMVGAYLLMTWGLPWPVVDAVARHHQLELESDLPLGVGDVVGIAHLLVDDVAVAAERLRQSPRLEALGLTGQVAAWVDHALAVTSVKVS